MVFSSLIFAYGFLPLVILLVFVTSKWTANQNVVLLIASLLFYSWGEPKHIWLFIGTVLINWLLVLLSSFFKGKRVVKVVGAATIFLNLGILFWFKYAGWIGGALGLTLGSTVLPIGISFYTFQAISYVADVTMMGKYPAEKNPVNVGLYIAFFVGSKVILPCQILITRSCKKVLDFCTFICPKKHSWGALSVSVKRLSVCN